MADLSFAFAHCETLVRDGDADRYWATLFAPAGQRPALFSLYAFSFEIARVRDAVREPAAGEIRLQWWRDALQGEARGDVRANPVAAALDDTIVRYRLPRQSLVDLVDAREFDLYDDPMPSLNDLEGYAGETSSGLMRLASLVLADGGEAGPPDAAGHGGVAYAVAGLLRALPWHARRGQVFIPADLLERHGATADDVVSGRASPELLACLADLRAVARRHLAHARPLVAAVPAPAREAFRPLGLVEPLLRAMERRGYDPFQSIVDLPRWRRLWALRRAL